jgi:AcrR family transcriptional regulator
MRPEKQAARRREIEKAAYEVLAKKGYGATSMLAVAKRAGASNETLYKWYGSKQELFRSMVEENAREVAELLRDCISSGRKPVDTLRTVGPILLRLLISEKAVALNRAAVMDSEETGILGRTLAEAGRNSIMPLVVEVFAKWRASGRVMFEKEEEEAAEIYVSLLVGDLQIRRAIGVLDPLRESEVLRRAARALELVQRLATRR